GIDMDAALAAQLANRVAVDDSEFETELISHLFLPLYLEGRRTHDEDGADAVAQDQFLYNESSLDRFAQANIVSYQQIHPWHRQSAHDRIKLILVHFDPAAER